MNSRSWKITVFTVLALATGMVAEQAGAQRPASEQQIVAKVKIALLALDAYGKDAYGRK